ncbi:unnamed protein product [Prunus armeniaca]|uniref:EF-hand domain-containing protein n=1 Tax=Prunus armeniaca TaxID=36596 RepID=A0A6J5XZ44_PRUAR|nr:unnamed protein product [Prunus armeniaca]CAB4317533.1 unnamed protein product [Prunus armeniaca]
MEETREAALACFDNLSEEQKDKAWEDFEAMDLDGDGTITLIEYQQFYYGSSYRIPFQQLDTNRDGKLNFQEFKTLFYLLLNSRGTTPLIPTQDQPESSESNQLKRFVGAAKLFSVQYKDIRLIRGKIGLHLPQRQPIRPTNMSCAGIGCLDVVMKAIEDFNSCWAFASAVASVASGLFNG